MPLGNLRQHSSVKLPAEGLVCKESSFAIVAAIPGTYQVSIHNSCLCNEKRALYCRHLIDRSYIPFDNALWKAAVDYSLPEINKLDVEYTNIYTIANGYTGGKRKQYLRACERIDVEGYMRKDAVLKMFVKPDKYPAADIESKPPRAIQYRSPKYNLLLGSYLKDFEHKFYQISTGRSNTPDMAKGRNLVERAEDLIAKGLAYNDPIFLNVDYSKMDSCVRIEHQRYIFRKVYLRKFRSKLLKQLLWAQLNNKGYSKNGIKYRVRGTRCSGDFNTGLENTEINWFILRYILKLLHIVADIYIDGDDSVIVMEKSEREKFQNQAPELFLKLGFEAKLNWATDIQQVDFCQSRVLLTNPPRMARNPLRALSNFNVSLKNYPAKVWPRLIEAKACSEEYGNPGVPILSEIGAKFHTGAKPMLDKEQEFIINTNKDLSLSIDDSVRLSYEIAWDISPFEQELIVNDPNLVSIITGNYYDIIATKYQTLAPASQSIN